MHEPVGSERHCRNWLSRTCFAGLIENNGVCDPTFGLCEFTRRKNKKPSSSRGGCGRSSGAYAFCALDRRCLLGLWLLVVTGKRCFLVVYSPISNIVGQRGEYCAESCFVSSPTRYEGVSEPGDSHSQRLSRGASKWREAPPTASPTTRGPRDVLFFFFETALRHTGKHLCTTRSNKEQVRNSTFRVAEHSVAKVLGESLSGFHDTLQSVWNTHFLESVVLGGWALS